MAPPRRGRLLVAAPSLDDPNFFRTVVLLLASDEHGALGVVLNRPSAVPVGEIVPEWAVHASAPGVLFTGGPVQPSAAICVGRRVDGGSEAPDGSREGSRDADGFAPLVSGLGTVDLHRQPDELDVALSEIRIFKGYSGWSASQLEAEIEDDAWLVIDGSPGDVFTAEPEQLWEQVLRRQGGWLAVLARHPVNPSLN